MIHNYFLVIYLQYHDFSKSTRQIAIVEKTNFGLHSVDEILVFDTQTFIIEPHYRSRTYCYHQDFNFSFVDES